MWYQHVRLLFGAPFIQLAIGNEQLQTAMLALAYYLLLFVY
jgi:hypothetical protein